jgi:pimeloyl-ACP methyl ester carboxylesterase
VLARPVAIEYKERVSEAWFSRDGVRLSVADDGAGIPIVLLHGLTATKRYVVMGSRSLERSGHRTIAIDARGHGRSTPASAPTGYTYDDLGLDVISVLDELGIDRAVLAGASMGAHTALWLALHSAERVGGLVVITPAYEPESNDDPDRLARWDALADGLRRGGVEGFVEAYGEPHVPPAMRDTVLTVIRQRLSAHDHPDAVADALSAVPRSRPFGEVGELAEIDVPVTVVASGDEIDPGHPQEIGERYAATIPDATLVLDEPGRSPVAWQGSQLSRVIAELAARTGVEA